MSLVHEPLGHGEETLTVRYSLLVPETVRVLRADGNVETVGLGIGDTLEIKELAAQFCIRGPRRKHLDLTNGDRILDIPDSFEQAEYEVIRE